MFTTALIGIAALATSESPAAKDAAAAVDIGKSNYWFGVLLLLASVAVIVIALLFVLRYHEKLMNLIAEGVDAGKTTVGAVSEDALAGGVGAQARIGAVPAITGPDRVLPGTQVVYVVKDAPAGASISWAAEGAEPSSARGATYVVTFAKANTYEIAATVMDGNAPVEVTPKKVVAGNGASTTKSTVVLPFVVKNWGRLVIVIFGVGVISALMAIGILTSGEGIGILGTLLGAGAVSASSDTKTEKPKEAEDD